MIVPDVLRKRAAEAPDRTAIEVDGGGTVRYGEWEQRSNRLARVLLAEGVAPGDRVALWLGSAHFPDYAVAYFAVQKAGGVVVPLNTRLSPREVAGVVDHAEPTLLLSEPGTDAPSVLAGCRRPPRSIDAWRDRERDHDDTAVQVARDDADLADILYTSGTTGAPRGVASTHADVARIAHNPLGRAFPGATFFHAFPAYGFAGTHGMMMMGLSGALETITQGRFDAARFLALLVERSIAIAYLAPAMLRLVIDRPETVGVTYERLRVLLYGSAATPADTITRAAKLFPNAMQLNVYGLTEGGAAACVLPPDEALRRPGSIGRPAPPTEVSIRGPNGEEVAAGTTGEIQLRSPLGHRRYYRNDEATRASWTEDGWLRTGDLGHLDAEGFLYLDGRARDTINRGGFKIFPSEVEAVLAEHPAVREAAVIAVQHPILGEDVAAVVILVEGKPASPDDLLAHCAGRLADYKRPRRIEIRDDLPRNAMGKVLKRVLREQLKGDPS